MYALQNRNLLSRALNTAVEARFRLYELCFSKCASGRSRVSRSMTFFEIK
jgi:hypothetical protein